MGINIRNNLSGTNAYNKLSNASGKKNKSIERNASGYRINRASDDASGLAISEKMKNQIKALDTAADNCADGINFLQTAEGYLSETHEMLNRMTELSEKAANGVLDDNDRSTLQKEMDQICGEIDRIASTANFNGHKLFDGSFGGNGTIEVLSDSVDGNSLSAAKINSTGAFKLSSGETSDAANTLSIEFNNLHTDTLFRGLDGFVNHENDLTNTASTAKLKIKSNNDVSTYNNSCSLNITDQDSASAAADVLRYVGTYISNERGKISSAQNNLEHSIHTLTISSENTTAANSRIRDTDMATEMMLYTSKNVVEQAAQSMLAQANSQPQNVLSLLQ